jgi:hypothetical protein
VDGVRNGVEFERLASERSASGGPNFDPRRWFCEDDEVVHANGKTYAFSNQWGGKNWYKAMNLLKEKYPQFKIEFLPEA